MAESVQLCSHCGHLSPTEWAECHSCSKEFEDEADTPLEELNRYYRAIERGYGRYAILGYLLFVGSPIVSTVGLVLLFGFFGSADEAGAVVLLVGFLLLPTVGFSTFFGCHNRITGEFSPEAEAGLGRTILHGFGVTVLLAVVLGILFVIPIVNAIVGLILLLGLLVSPYYNYRLYERIQVDQPTAVAALLAYAERVGESDADLFGDRAEDAEGTSPVEAVRESVPESLLAGVADTRSKQAVETAVSVVESAPASRFPAGYGAGLSARVDSSSGGVAGSSPSPGTTDPAGTTSEPSEESSTSPSTTQPDGPVRDPETGAFTEAGAGSE